jgi:hypothetical protein
MICNNCGKRVGKDIIGKCEFCTSSFLIPVSI